MIRRLETSGWVTWQPLFFIFYEIFFFASYNVLKLSEIEFLLNYWSTKVTLILLLRQVEDIQKHG